MATKLSVTQSVFVRSPPEDVWDFTQDYARRRSWDRSVLDASVLQSEPSPRVAVRCAGGLRAVFQYVLFDRPRRTSLTLEEVRSFLIQGGGGSWSYEGQDGGTLWTQVNMLAVKSGWWRRLLVPLVRRQLLASTRRAMRTAKGMIEAASPSPVRG